jgi:peptide deformylase
MALLEIVKVGDDILRQAAEPVTDFGDPALQQLIDDMIETMREAPGVGLAAPQIGRSLRLAVIETPAEEDEEGNELPDSRQLYTIINPIVVWESPKTVKGVEGCLSIPGHLGEVSRPWAVHLQARNRHGRQQRFRLRGWDARIFLHEIDHLDGILYTDKLTNPDRYWTEEAFEALQERKSAEATEETSPTEDR